LYLKIERQKYMAIIITDDCINCGACEPECPNTAIYEGAAKWRFSDGTGFTGKGAHPTAGDVDADKENDAISMDLYYISPEKCTECVGFHDEPQCAAVCPVDCCIDDEDVRESEEVLLSKKTFLHV
jgi:ferredoxin